MILQVVVIRQITWGFIGCCVCSICTKLFLLSLNKQNNTIQIYFIRGWWWEKFGTKIIKKKRNMIYDIGSNHLFEEHFDVCM